MPSLADPAPYSGFGLMGCREISPSLQQVATQKVTVSWPQGYMTALNFSSIASDNRFRDLSGLSEPYMLRRFEDGCAQKPDQRLLEIILGMYSDLPLVELEAE